MTARAAEPRGAEEVLAGLRRIMRTRRAALSSSERRRLATQIAAAFARTRFLRPGHRISAYRAVRGEADPALIIRAARRLGCRIFLPKVTSRRHQHMEFFELGRSGLLRRNRLGLWEPAGTSRIQPRHLDLVLMPLVAFDSQLNRLGMGAGYFDRRFAFLRRRNTWRRPKLIGIAYEFQRVASLPTRVWDVPLDLVVTEKAVHRPLPRGPDGKGHGRSA